MSKILPGEGTTLQIKVAATFVTIGGVTEIDGPEVTLAAIKSTILNANRHGYRRSRLPDFGKLSIKGFFDPNDSADVHQLLYSKLATPATDDVDDQWKLVFNDGQVVPAHATFDGFLTKFKLSNEKIEENLMFESEIQVNTAFVFTEGAAT